MKVKVTQSKHTYFIIIEQWYLHREWVRRMIKGKTVGNTNRNEATRYDMAWHVFVLLISLFTIYRKKIQNAEIHKMHENSRFFMFSGKRLWWQQWDDTTHTYNNTGCLYFPSHLCIWPEHSRRSLIRTEKLSHVYSKLEPQLNWESCKWIVHNTRYKNILHV